MAWAAGQLDGNAVLNASSTRNAGKRTCISATEGTLLLYI